MDTISKLETLDADADIDTKDEQRDLNKAMILTDL